MIGLGITGINATPRLPSSYSSCPSTPIPPSCAVFWASKLSAVGKLIAVALFSGPPTELEGRTKSPEVKCENDFMKLNHL